VRRALALAALLATLPACRYFRPAPDPAADVGDWAQARRRYTARAKLYDGFTTRAFATAVYEAPEVREARIARLAAWKALPDTERDRLLQEERTAAAQFDEVTLAFFTTDRVDNDLDARGSIWRIVLEPVGEQGEAAPLLVQALRPDATLRTLYPDIGDFDTVYRVRFPRWQGEPLSGRPFLVRLLSARGKLDLEFSP
jgi:hypothetical protein